MGCHHVEQLVAPGLSQPEPYDANFAAIGLAQATRSTGDTGYVAAAWSWLRWYAAPHQDASGFVTDYTVDANGVERSTGDMDSTDAYAGTFLLAARATYRVDANRKKLRELTAGINGAVKAIEATRDADGLTWAKPAWRVKYLMDQAETYAGLRAATDLATALGDSALAARSTTLADSMRAALVNLWNAPTTAYDWAVHADGARTATDWAVLYPDVMQQAWAVAFAVGDPAYPGAAADAGVGSSGLGPPPARDRQRQRCPGRSRQLGGWRAGHFCGPATRPGRRPRRRTSDQAPCRPAERGLATGNAGQLIVLQSGSLATVL